MDNRIGKIAISGEKADITFERRLPHPVEKVWTAITEPDKRAKWFGPTTIEPKAGGRMITTAEGPPAPEDVRRTTAEILTWEPPYVFEYREEALNVGETVTRFELEDDGDSTILRLTNSRLRAGDARGYAPGWHAFLDRLEAHLNQETLPVWGERYGEVRAEYA